MAQSESEPTVESLTQLASTLNDQIGLAIDQEPQAKEGADTDLGFRKKLGDGIDLALNTGYPNGAVIDLEPLPQYQGEGVLMAHSREAVLSFFPASGPSVPMRTDYIFKAGVRRRVVLEHSEEHDYYPDDEIIEEGDDISPQDFGKITTALERLTEALQRNYPNLSQIP